MTQPMVEPTVASSTYSGIQCGLAVANAMSKTSALLGSGTNVESSRHSVNSPNAPNVTRYADSRAKLFPIPKSNNFKYVQCPF